MRKIWLLVVALILLSTAGEARDGHPAVYANRTNWHFWGGGWDAPGSKGAFYGARKEFSLQEAPQGWWSWAIKIEGHQGQTRDGWHFGALEPYMGPGYLCLGRNGEVCFYLLYGTQLPVPDWNDGTERGEARGVTIHPQLRIDLYNSFLKPEINLAYKDNAELEWTRFEGEGKFLLFQKGSFQIKGGVWGERDEVQGSYQAEAYGLLLEPKILGQSSSFTIFIKGGYAREELCNNVSTGPKWIAGCCWSF
jgi:hypothetical protein